MSWEEALEDGSHTVGRWLTDRAAQSPRRIAIDDRGVTIDYATLAMRATELAEGFRMAGYGAGHRLATVSGNSTDHVVAFFACALAGIAFVPLSWRLTPRELGEVLRRADPALVLVRRRVRLARGRGAGRARGGAAGRAARLDGNRGIRSARARAPCRCGTCATTIRCW